MGGMRDGGAVAAELVQQSVDHKPEAIYEFRKLETVIHPEGDDAKVTITTTTGKFNLNVPFEYIARANTAIRRATILMLHRQSMKKDAGQNALDELLKTALRPRHVSVAVDRATGDRNWILQFDDHGIVVVRMSPEMESAAAAELAAAIKQTAN